MLRFELATPLYISGTLTDYNSQNNVFRIRREILGLYSPEMRVMQTILVSDTLNTIQGPSQKFLDKLKIEKTKNYFGKVN